MSTGGAPPPLKSPEKPTPPPKKAQKAPKSTPLNFWARSRILHSEGYFYFKLGLQLQREESSQEHVGA